MDMNDVLNQAAEQPDETGAAARWWKDQIQRSIHIDEKGVRCDHRTRLISAGRKHPICLSCGAELVGERNVI